MIIAIRVIVILTTDVGVPSLVALFLKVSYIHSTAKSFSIHEGLPRCPLNDPIETGRIQDPELVEASGLVASHKYPGVYYSIQDSLNPSNVYAIRYDGHALGKKIIFRRKVFLFHLFKSIMYVLICNNIFCAMM